MITGIHDLTWQRMLLGAGTLIANLHLPRIADAGIIRQIVEDAIAAGQGIIGATQGGARFRCTPKIRRLEEGYRTPCRDSVTIDSWHVQLKGKMLEFTPENAAASAVCAAVQQMKGLTVIEPCTARGMEQYIDTLYWVGDTACGYVLIELTNALNTGAELTISDTGEGAMAFTFEAHLGNTQHDGDAPCRILLLEETKHAKEQ